MNALGLLITSWASSVLKKSRPLAIPTWLPELYPTDCRASAIAFISSVGRFVGVAMVFLVGAGIRSYGSLGVPVAVTAVAFIFGLMLLPLTEETRGRSLPA